MVGPPDSMTGRRRQGGREARRRLREIRSEDRLAVRPGFDGGRYRPLTEEEVGAIHRRALDVLAEIGMDQVPPVVVERALGAGCHLNPRGRLCFPRSFVEDIVAGAGRNFVLHGRESRHDLEITGRRVYFGTGGAAVRTLEVGADTYRASTLADLYDFTRLADQLDNISWFTRCVVATDVTDSLDLDMNTAYALLAGTTKHVGMSFVIGEHVSAAVKMFDTVLGGEGRFKERPFCKAHISPVVSPLRYGEDAVDVTLAAIREGMPVNAIIAAQAGATAPAPLAGMLTQTLAETLAGLILVNLFAPGHPVIFSNWPFVSDLRTGAFSGSGGEISVLNAAAAQMAHYYDLPAGVSASMADSKVPDAQAGYEKAISTLATGLAGGNLIYEAAGMFASLLGASFEGLVIDNEMLGSVLRTVRGIEVNDETLDIGVIEEVVYGPGHFLGHDQTIAVMERDYHYPELGDRDTPDVWSEGGAKDMRTRATEKVREVLATHYPRNIEPAADLKIREEFNILLPAEKMTPAG